MRVRAVCKTLCIVLPSLIYAPSSLASPFEDLVNAKFPPVNADQQQQRAIKTAIDILNSSREINVAASLTLVDVQNALMARPEVQKLGVTTIEFSGKDQILGAVFTVDRVLDGRAIPDNRSQLKALFDKLHPQILARVSVGLAVESSAAGPSNDINQALTIRLLPIFRSIKVDKLTVQTGTLGELFGQPSVDITGATDGLVSWINAYANQISGALNRLEIAKLTVPSTPFSRESVNRSFEINDKSGLKVSLKMNGTPVSAPARISAAAWYIDEDRLTLLVNLSPTVAPPSAPPPTQPATYTPAELKRLVSARMASSFGLQKPPSESWVAVNKGFAASMLNSAFLQAHLCLSGSADIPRQEFSNKVRLPSGAGVDCTPTKKCDQPHDERDCNRCLVSAFGRCQVRGNDPICEAAKAGQNAVYASNKAACEAEKSTTKGLCESKKGALDALARTGNFANIDGSFGTGSASMTACFQSVTVAPQLNKVDFSLSVGGDGSADVGLKFTPLDIAGHLACQVPWTENRRVSVKVPTQQVKISTNIDRRDQPREGLAYRINIRTSALNAQIRPAPRDLILSSYNMQLSCPAVGMLVSGIAFNASPFIPELQGNIAIPGQELSLDYEFDPVKLSLGGTPAVLVFSDTGSALVAVKPGIEPLTPWNCRDRPC